MISDEEYARLESIEETFLDLRIKLAQQEEFIGQQESEKTLRGESKIMKNLNIFWCATICFVWMISCPGLSSAHPSLLIHLERPDRGVSFQVEVAQTPQALEQGLMDRQTLAKDAGMLFIFPKVQYVQFWMKNTYLALDMIFMDQNKRVVQLHAQANPLDLTRIMSLKPVKYVLEIAAGSIKDHDIQEGDLLSWELY